MNPKRLLVFVLSLPTTVLIAQRPAELPPLIPRKVFFADASKTSPDLSPDGTRLAYLAPSEKGVQNVWVQTLGKRDDVAITRETRRPVNLYRWAEDGEHILYLQDSDGDENWHVYSADLKSPGVRDLTPFEGVRAQNMMTSRERPREVLVGLNRRNPRIFDMYRVDLSTGTVRLDTENPGDVVSWMVDNRFVIRAATAFDVKTGDTILRVRDAAGKPWRDLIRWPFEDGTLFGWFNGATVTPGFAPGGRSLYVVSALHSDKARLVRVDTRTGAELGTIAEDTRSDVAEDPNDAPDTRPLVLMSPVTHRVQAVGFEYLKYGWKFVDRALQEDFERLGQDGSRFFMPVSRDRRDGRWIVNAISDDGSQKFVLYDRRAKTVRPVFEEGAPAFSGPLPRRKPLVIPARDGLPLVSYLTLPLNAGPGPLPMVLVPHGGPWSRNDWGPDDWALFLANRGYAVLQVNFRGSTGFGKKFLNAGNHQFGLGMQEDLTDGVRWAIREGIADPKRIAIMGSSAGGYAALRGVTETPELYRCAVDLVGPTDLKVLLESMPPYSAGARARWLRRIGDVEHDEQLNHNLSPLYHVDRVRVPILIGQGANDPLVNIKNSDLLAQALRGRGLSVTYVVYTDEGHGFNRPENNLDFFGRVEEFLAKNLGGRAEPWKKVPGSTAELR